MLVYLLQIIVLITSYCYLRKNIIRYIAVITSVYFLAYLISGSYDIALPIYCASIIFGIGFVASIPLQALLYCTYIVIYVILGLLFQKVFLTIATVITRYGYILLYIWFLYSKRSDNKDFAMNTDDFRFAVRLGIATELLLIAIIWLRDGWGTRIITNNQPIGGGIVIALTTIIGYCYLTKRFTATETVFYCVVIIVITLLSGTRGYMVIIFLQMMVIFLMYLLDVPNSGQRAPFRVATILILLAFVVVGVLVLDKGRVLSSILRLQEGLGYRENENVFVKEIMRTAPWYNKLFGFGFGGSASNINGFYEALKTASWNRPIMFYKLKSSTIFHNYWYTILFKQGIIGLIGIAMFYLVTFKQVLCLNTSRWMRFLLAMMLAGTVISLTFRITATCSVFEMMIVAYFIRLLSSDKKLQQEGTL